MRRTFRLRHYLDLLATARHTSAFAKLGRKWASAASYEVTHTPRSLEHNDENT